MSADWKERQHKAVACYRLGNQLFKRGQWESALSAWKMAHQYWLGKPADAPARSLPRRYLHAVFALIGTVLCIYAVLFLVFPRQDYPLYQFSVGSENSDTRSWWERLLDNGRPGSSDFPITMREWWRQRMNDWRRDSARDGGNGQGGYRPSIDQRWQELLLRHGRWGTQPNLPLNYHVTAGYSLNAQGKHEAAIAIIEAGLENTNHPEHLAELHQALGNVYYDRGRRLLPDGLAAYDQSDIKKARLAYENALQYRVSALSYGNLGWMAFVLGDYSLAQHYSNEALRLNGQLHYVRLNLGMIYLAQGRNREALWMYKNALKQNLPDITILGGIKDLRELLREREIPHGWLMLGMLALRSQEYGKASDALNRFLKSGYSGQEWTALAQRLLRTMDWRAALP